MKKAALLLFLLVLFVNGLFAQATNDAGLWATLNLEKKFKHNTFVFVTEELRLRENYTRLNLLYTDIGVGIKPAKILKVSLAYRLIEKAMLDNTFSYRHRLMLDITLKKKFGDVAVSFRERLQGEVRNVNSSNDGSLPEYYSRNKFEVKYDSGRKIKPYVSFEFRYQLHNPRMVEVDHLWHRARCAFGIDYEKNKRDTFGLYYLLQGEYNVSAPQNLYIVGVEYSISL